ncbi:TolC family protein [Silvanigrella sp.]|uniref:TolC family protein n=1 Tax=Silvanigrella sp. TaxID=2024976 RepID=UPI0037CA77EB
MIKLGKYFIISLFIFKMLQIECYSIEIKGTKASLDQNTYKLSLEGCLKIALQNSTDILKQNSMNDLNGVQVLRSYANFLPNLTTQMASNYTTGTSYLTTATPTYVNGSGTTSTFSISSNFNIFNGFSDTSSLDSYLLKKDASEFTLNRVKQQIILDIVQNYLQIILDNKMIEIAEQNLQESATREKLLTAQSRLGSKSIADLYLQQSQTSSAESYLQTLKNKIRNDQIILLQKLRLDIQKNYKFTEVNLEQTQSEKKYDDENEIIKLALNKRLDIKASQNLTKASKYDIEVAKSGYYPKIDFMVSASSSGTILETQTVNGNNVVPNNQDNLNDQLLSNVKYYFGITLSWNIFDRLVTFANVNQAATSSYQLKLDEENINTKVLADARTAYGNYKLAIQELESSAKGIFASQKAYQVMTGRYKVGSASFIDLMTAQSNLVQAESTRAQALINFKLQNWNIRYATGELEAK